MDTSVVVLIAVLALFLLMLVPLLMLVLRIGSVQTEFRVLSAQVSRIEIEQTQLRQNIDRVSANLVEMDTVTKSLADTTSVIHTALMSAQQSLAAIEASQQREQEIAEAIKRLEAVIAGSKKKGTAGENIIDLVFAQLPPEWQVRNFRIGNKTVEFGLHLPNGLVLPIDSKWVATDLLEQFFASNDEKERRRLKSEIEKTVLARAKEVQKYIDPSATVNFGIVVIPDAVFDLCSSAQVEALKSNVVLVSYSMFVPYLLLVFQTILKTSRDIDLEKLNSSLETVQGAIKSLQDEIEGRFSQALNMLTNSRDEIRSQVSKISTALVAVQVRAGATQETALSAPATGVRTS